MRILILFTLAAAEVLAQHSAMDAVPFENWLRGSEMRLKWSIHASSPTLTSHQRLMVRFSIQVDGAEFIKRPEQGRLVSFLEIRDKDQHPYRIHNQIEFNVPPNPTDLQAVHVDVGTFMTPGVYQVSAAVFDRKTKEYSVKRLPLRVAPLARDPLPDSWLGLPALEVINSPDRPDAFFLPSITSRLHLPLQTKRPVRLEVLVNESPTEAARGRMGQATRRNMSTLFPAIKVMSQIDAGEGSVNVSMLDLERRKVTFAQENVHQLDWPRMREELTETNPNLIDVHALENHDKNAQFFVSEVRKRLEQGSIPRCWSF